MITPHTKEPDDMLPTKQIAENLYEASGCPCGWRSVADFMSVAIAMQLQHQAACPVKRETESRAVA